MSGHSKWHSIKHKKEIADAKRGKIFTKHAQLIALAARSGGDPETNPALRLAIDNAKIDNTPNANIERAIKRGTGEGKEGADLQEVMYEAYGPEATALLIACVTDNKNRTVSQIKGVLTKHNGHMGTTGSVAYLFSRKGILTVDKNDGNSEEVELAIIESGADNFEKDGASHYSVSCPPENLAETKANLLKSGLAVKKSELSYLAHNHVTLADVGAAKKVLDLMEKIDDLDDVVNVYSNFDIAEEVMKNLV